MSGGQDSCEGAECLDPQSQEFAMDVRASNDWPVPVAVADQDVEAILPYGQDYHFSTIQDFPQIDFNDFDVEQLPFDNTSFPFQPVLGPTAPLTPALTPPPLLHKSSKTSSCPSLYQSDDQRWQAIQARSRKADQYLIYGVKTTKIFCRPSCPSRRPSSRTHVTFFSFPGAVEAAENARFRPCKRCKPSAAAHKTDTALLGVIKVLRLVIADAAQPFDNSPVQLPTTLRALAEQAGLSPFHFHRLFRTTTHLTPGGFYSACRALLLGDALGRDARNSLFHKKDAENDVKSLHKTLSLSTKWTSRAARKALGNVRPADYAAGGDSSCRCTDGGARGGPRIGHASVNTKAGLISVAYTIPSSRNNKEGDNGSGLGDESGSMTKERGLLTVLLGPTAEARMRLRFPRCLPDGGRELEDPVSRRWRDLVERSVQALAEEEEEDVNGGDRLGDVLQQEEDGEDVQAMLYRARVWCRLVRDESVL